MSAQTPKGDTHDQWLQSMDDALGAILDTDWQTQTIHAEPEPAPEPEVVATKEQAITAPTASEQPEPSLTPVPTQTNAVAAPDSSPSTGYDEDADPSEEGITDIGMLARLATGRTTAEQAAQMTGMTLDEIESALATTLQEVSPEDIAKAMGVQAAHQQLKSGAIYGVVLADLVRDLRLGKLDPSRKLELARMLARVGKIEPKEDKNVGTGSGFVLNISMGNADPQPIIIEAGET